MRIPFPSRRVVSGSLATLSIGAMLVLPGGRLDAQAVPADGRPAARAGGQPEASRVRLPLRGVVVDAQSGAPIDYATVELEGEYRSTATTAEGAFSFRRLKPGGYMLVVRQLGYREHRQYVPLRDAADLRVALSPEPLVLEALKVTYSRFEQRRRSAPVSVRVLNRRDLATTAYSDAQQLVQTRMLLQPTNACHSNRWGLGSHGGSCGAMIRGTPTQVAVWIDERPALGGIEELSFYDPSQLHTIEMYDGGRMIRVYTVWYMETAAMRKVRPQPLFF